MLMSCYHIFFHDRSFFIHPVIQFKMSARRAGVPANLKKFKGQVRLEMEDALIEIRLKNPVPCSSIDPS